MTTLPRLAPPRCRSTAAAALAAAACAAALSACTAGQTDTTPAFSTPRATAAAVPCRSTVRAHNGDVKVSVRGSVTCEQAVAVAQAYYADTTHATGSGAYLQVDGFDCVSTSGAVALDTGSAGSCSRTADGESSPNAEILLRDR